MALRVLLADESSTIKKVFQLSLQDYAAEVKSVHLGVDVLAVAEDFQPDIVFADVLLQKKNGYEVCSEIKQNSTLQQTPVVLMWSGFMEIDQEKFQAVGANESLEKPFDTEKLREIVQSLVAKTRSQRISDFIETPNAPSVEASVAPTNSDAPANLDADLLMPSAPTASAASDWDMDNFEAPNFDSAQSSEAPADLDLELVSENSQPDDDLWKPQGIEAFRTNINVEDNKPSDDFEPQVDDLIDADTAKSIMMGELTNKAQEAKEEASLEPRTPAAPAAQTNAPAVQIPELSEEQIEHIVRSHSKEVIEKVVWRIVPELASQLIERELHRLLDEKDREPFA